MKQNNELLIKEYHEKYSNFDKKIVKEMENASKEADAILDDY